jgi:hypothetical protein
MAMISKNLSFVYIKNVAKKQKGLIVNYPDLPSLENIHNLIHNILIT